MLKIVIKGKLGNPVVEQNSDEQVAEDPFKLAGASVKNCDRFLSTASKDYRS